MSWIINKCVLQSGAIVEDLKSEIIALMEITNIYNAIFWLHLEITNTYILDTQLSQVETGRYALI